MSNFIKRHIGPSEEEQARMLEVIGEKSIDHLINRTIPENIRFESDLNISQGMDEQDYLKHIQQLAGKNKVYKSFIGMGYYETFVPPVIQRNVLENPGWYTAYTPYQAEIAQGRLEALLNFQTTVMDLTQMDIANASLLDEGTAAAESMFMFFGTKGRKEADRNKCFVDENCFPQTIEVLRGRADNLNIELIIDDYRNVQMDETYFCAIVQYPNAKGTLHDYSSFIRTAHDAGAKVAVGADLMALALCTPPGEWDADVVYGTTQRFGVPMGFGGPHAAYFATKEAFKRNIPGRIIGVSQDKEGNRGLRMALQTREQHIRRDKATSNICTAQALLAVMAGMYALYHGPKGIRGIAGRMHKKAKWVKKLGASLGLKPKEGVFFDTVTFEKTPNTSDLEELTEQKGVNFWISGEDSFSINIGETIDNNDLSVVKGILESFAGKKSDVEVDSWDQEKISFEQLGRSGEILTHPVFSKYHSETKMMRYLKHLENKDLSLVHSMIPLGSCTMKLNAASELMPITWPEFANIHPYAPDDQTQGYLQILEELKADLCEVTGFAGISLQPNSGAQGEYTGLMTIRAYHIDRGDMERKVVLIPSSAHGTNPASAVVAGLQVVVVKCDERGNIDVEDLKLKAEKHQDELCALMVTYPSTHGVFEEEICEITSIVHQHGGQVYMDGANMNAQVGLTSPGKIGADVCHLNLHKTFAIPHGGGGPGMGPIGVAKHLTPYLPGKPIERVREKAIHAISSAPFGSALILLISYGYIKMLGVEGLRRSTEVAILNANYIRAKLRDHYNVLYTGKKDTVAHEMILDCRDFKKSANVEVEDIAKRLIDFCFHSPTVSFPVAGTVMIEPTESEDKDELDRFCEAMIKIRSEIREVENGVYDKSSNMLKNAPHTAECLIREWNESYSREEAAYPLPYVRNMKFWAPVRRVDNATGDRNLICSCPPMDAYESPEEMMA